MRIVKLAPNPDWTISLLTDDGQNAHFDVRPYLKFEAFTALKDVNEFMKIRNGGYFIEWDCGADLSADTIEAKMSFTGKTP